MKHRIIIVTLITVFALTSLQAQTKQGHFIIGGASSIEVSQTKGGFSTAPSESKVTTISIKPEVGYFLFDNFSVGLSANLLGYTSGSVSGDASLLSEFKYFFQGTNYRPFVKANMGYRYKNLRDIFSMVMYVNEAHGLAFGGGVGGAFFVRENLSIDLELQYLYSNLKQIGGPYYDFYTDTKKEYVAKANEIKIFVGFSLYL
ncbi:MAG: hypothetical protein Q4G63_05455 [Bacteroidia bacterium]|nr:hypothetical protein [Bacteroidia bacterium]